MPERADGALGFGQQLVLGGFGAVAARDAAERLPRLVEERVRVLGEEGLLRGWDRERVAAEDELSPETDAQREYVTLSDDDAVQIGL